MKVVIGISGGVDSAVAAYLLKEKGYDVIGVTLYLFDYITDKGEKKVPGFLEDGKGVCDQLGIEHVVLDMRESFDEVVISDFLKNYEKGWIPNPCLLCNPLVKYQALLEYANQIDAPYIATGHYAKILKDTSGRYTIERPKAERKDQTYPLACLSQEQLSRILWPLEDMASKDDIRHLAKKNGLKVHGKTDSWGICFIDKGDYRGYLDHLYSKAHQGNFVDHKERVLGPHKGTHHYTIGQKRKLGIEGNHTVVKIDGITKNITLGPDDLCYHTALIADDYWGMLWEEPKLGQPLIAKICQWGYELEGKVSSFSDGLMVLEFKEAVRAVTLGQRVVLYEGRKILGSGRIIKRKK